MTRIQVGSLVYTANILIVKNTTFHCVLFPMYFQCIFSTQEMLVVNGCIKCNETTALNRKKYIV
jgi:hypothetical protein